MEAVLYLDERRWGLGEELRAAVDEICERIAEGPPAFPRATEVDGEIRRALLDRFDRWLLFEIVEQGAAVRVLSLWHTRRDPDAWRRDD